MSRGQYPSFSRLLNTAVCSFGGVRKYRTAHTEVMGVTKHRTAYIARTALKYSENIQMMVLGF